MYTEPKFKIPLLPRRTLKRFHVRSRSSHVTFSTLVWFIIRPIRFSIDEPNQTDNSNSNHSRSRRFPYKMTDSEGVSINNFPCTQQFLRKKVVFPRKIEKTKENGWSENVSIWSLISHGDRRKTHVMLGGISEGGDGFHGAGKFLQGSKECTDSQSIYSRHAWSKFVFLSFACVSIGFF